MTQEPEPSRKKRLPLRWLTLAEIVGISALAIAGLGYWDSHRERLQQDQERAAAERQSRARRGRAAQGDGGAGAAGRPEARPAADRRPGRRGAAAAAVEA